MSEIVELPPNSIIIRDMSISESERATVRNRYGNTTRKESVHLDVLFFVVGDGTNRYKLWEYIEIENRQM